MNFSRSTRTLRTVTPSPLTRSVFPADAQAMIYKAAPSPNRAGHFHRALGRRGFRPEISPAEAYPHPNQVLVDNALSPTRKREILRQWALDAYRIENEHAKPDNRSRLHEVIDALLDLEEPQISAMSFSHLDRKAS
jgi:hypothetical protein